MNDIGKTLEAGGTRPEFSFPAPLGSTDRASVTAATAVLSHFSRSIVFHHRASDRQRVQTCAHPI